MTLDPVAGKKFVLPSADCRSASMIFTAVAAGGTRIQWQKIMLNERALRAIAGLEKKHMPDPESAQVTLDCIIPRSCIAGFLMPALIRCGMSGPAIQEARKTNPILGTFPSVQCGISPLIAGLHPGDRDGTSSWYMWDQRSLPDHGDCRRHKYQRWPMKRFPVEIYSSFMVRAQSGMQ